MGKDAPTPLDSGEPLRHSRKQPLVIPAHAGMTRKTNHTDPSRAFEL